MNQTEQSPIQLEKVNKSFENQLVLSDINCQFHLKKITAIVGKSGSGKSTLLKLINGLELPDSGMIKVFGDPINYERAEYIRRQMGYSVQGTGLFPHLSVRQNISLLAEAADWSKDGIERRLTQLLDLVDLDQDLIDRYPHQISGGQQQRVGLSRAMMLDPKILLFDEAFAAVDPMTRQDIHSQILKLQNVSPKTIIMVTHDLQEAFRLADYIIIVNDKKIVSHEAKEYFLLKDSVNHSQNSNDTSNSNIEFGDSILQWLS